MKHLLYLLEQLKPDSQITDITFPTKKQLRFSVKNYHRIKNITLKNLNFEDVHLIFKVKNQTITSNITHLKSGIYFLEIENSIGFNYKKICIN